MGLVNPSPLYTRRRCTYIYIGHVCVHRYGSLKTVCATRGDGGVGVSIFFLFPEKTTFFYTRCNTRLNVTLLNHETPVPDLPRV